MTTVYYPEGVSLGLDPDKLMWVPEPCWHTPPPAFKWCLEVRRALTMLAFMWWLGGAGLGVYLIAWHRDDPLSWWHFGPGSLFVLGAIAIIVRDRLRYAEHREIVMERCSQYSVIGLGHDLRVPAHGQVDRATGEAQRD